VPGTRTQDRVEPFELFFDLVFVFILIQITRTIVEDNSITGIVHGTVVLILVWWVWVAFTSMANMGLPESDTRDWRPLIFAAAMGLLLLMALSIPQAFWANSQLFAYSYLGLALLAAGGQFLVARHDSVAIRALRRMWMVSLILPVLIVITSYVEDETLSVALIAVGIVTAVIAPFMAGGDNLPVSTSHLAERYSLFILITLGESIISIGEGASRATMSPLLIACVLIALALVVILWRHYTVTVLQPGERALNVLHGRRLTALERYGYTFAHLAMVWGVIMIAVAIKSAMIDLTTPLNDLLEAGLAAGALVFLATTVIFSRLAAQPLRRMTLAPLALLAVLTVLGPQLPTAILLVAVTLAAALGIDPRAIGFRQADLPSTSSSP
jgi:low temperature requirement protein LtrA